MQEQLYERLRQTTPARRPELEGMWEEAARRSVEALERDSKRVEQAIPEQYLVLVTCRDERQQVELLERFQGEGLECKALLS